ncbi:MAG: ImmA/IrrE family metallo-endopeptidase [Thermoanaerobaculia bacterium]|nr:ImmA/IrrE family metallo-endopeptidase [Thermoanaerobaculia bacterium]
MDIQPQLFEPEPNQAQKVVMRLLRLGRRPSAWELLDEIEKELGFRGRFLVEPALEGILADHEGTAEERAFVDGLLRSEDLQVALHGDAPPRQEAESTIDALFHASKVYGDSGKFQEAVSFMSKFKKFSAYNNLLVWLQSPDCEFYATQKDWLDRFGRRPKSDARPRIILAPMHPVLLVYDLEQTDGRPIPSHLTDFARLEGAWNGNWWRLCTENAVKDEIQVVMQPLSSQLAGYARRSPVDTPKMFVVINAGHSEPSRFGTLCHELAHIYLGHLGSDEDFWWPSRSGISGHAMEIEAEAATHVVTSRLGLTGTSAQYVSTHLERGQVPAGVSLDLIAKVAGRIETMARTSIPERKKKRERTQEERSL